MLTEATPKLDLHGEITSMVPALVKVFIQDNVKMKNNVVRIIHGRSTNILKNEVHSFLKSNKDVTKYFINNWNTGETIVLLKTK